MKDIKVGDIVKTSDQKLGIVSKAISRFTVEIVSEDGVRYLISTNALKKIEIE
jgi:hypothetical protein